MNIRRLGIIGAAIAALLLCYATYQRSQGPAPEYRQMAGSAWGTTYHITYQSDHDCTDAVQRQLALVNSLLSPFQKDSEISRVNRNETDSVGAHFSRIVALSHRVCSISGGAFDPTVAPLVNLWGFGYKQADAPAPSQEQIDSALASVGIRQCSITPDGRLIKKTPETEFDFSAIAKGYGVDMIAEALRAEGVKNFMVEVGGEIAVNGVNPRGNEWGLQIDAPVFEDGAPLHNKLTVITLGSGAVATSGNYRNYKHLGDSIVGHTISPITGTPVITTTLSATVIAPTCAEADALATAAMAMPQDSAVAMLKAQSGIRALLVISAPGSPAIINVP